MKHFILAATLSMIALPGLAATVVPESYAMLNGQTGSYEYWDQSYSGSGNPSASLSPLSGGTGDLTDGIIATQSWNVTEVPVGNGPYVGWLSINPAISFIFDTVYSFNSITFHFDDSNGAGGVQPPTSVVVNGVSSPVPNPTGGAPFAFTLDLSSVSPTDTLAATIFRSPGNWVFLSEVTFDAQVSAVPVPASLPLLAGALFGLGMMRRKRRSWHHHHL